MWLQLVRLLLSLAIILISCELFTNGIEWLGKRLRMGDGVVGSIFSAVGTCLPETTIPIVAILFSKGLENSTDIGVGAIIGAPFMLGTLAFFITGMSVLMFWKKRGTGMSMIVNNRILRRDISFFIFVYTIGIGVSFTDVKFVKYTAGVLLIAFYFYYVILTVRNDKAGHGELQTLYLKKYLNLRPRIRYIFMQILLAISGIIFGAELFVENIRTASDLLGIAPLALSLIVTPIATELPEKFNSIIWISRRKDTLALGNITGAMVFQSCIPVSIGIFATPWQLDIKAVTSAALAILSGMVTYAWIRMKGKINPVPLMFGGFFYAMFIIFLTVRGFK